MIAKRPISSFKEVLSGDHRSTTDIIFVHGLENKRTKALRRDLKLWLRDLGRRTNCRVSTLGFDASELLTKGRQRLTLLADHLHRDVKGLKGPHNLFFIGHEIAGWVIAEALARYTSGQVAIHTRRVVFLGLPELYNPKEWNEYAKRFLETYSKNLRCALDFPFLRIVDRNFEALKKSDYGPMSNVLYLRKSVQPSGKASLTSFDVNSLSCKIDTNPRQPGPLPVEEIPRRTTESSESSTSTAASLPEIPAKAFFEIRKGDENDEKVNNFLAKVVSGDQRNPHSGPTANPPGTGRKVVFSSQSPPKLDLEIKKLATSISAPDAVFENLEAPFESIYDNGYQSAMRTSSTEQVTLRVSDYDVATELPSENYEELLRVADLYQQRGELKKSNAIYTQLIEEYEVGKLQSSLEDIGHIKCQRAITWLYEGKFKEAEAAFRELEKSRCDTLQEQASLHEHEQTWEIARLLAVTFDLQGQYKDALDKLEDLEESIKTYPSEETDDTRFLAGSTRALVLVHMGEYENADTLSLQCCNDAERIMTWRIMKDDHGRIIDKNDEDATFWAKKLGTIQSNRAAVLTDAGIYEDADETNEKALRNMEKCFGSKHVATLDCWSLKARLLASKSNLDEAETQCQKTLTGMRREIGKEHPSTMRTLAIMVFIYKCQARLRDALDTARYLLEMNRASFAFGPKHPETIKSLCLLADIYVARGDFSNALSAQMEAKKLAEQYLGRSHPTTLAFTSYLAHIYCRLGSTNVARDIFCSVFVDQFGAFASPQDVVTEESLGGSTDEKRLWKILKSLRGKVAPKKVHLSILSTMQCLGVLERERHNGNLDLAREFHEVSFDLRRERLGAGHADTLSSQWELAITDRQLGYHAAKDEFESVLLARKALLGEEHPDTLSARHELSVTNCRLGFIESAATEQADLLRLRRFLLGNKHPDTTQSCVDLSHVYHNLGRLDEAEALQLEAVSAQIAFHQHPQLSSPDSETYVEALKVLNLETSMERNPSKELGQFPSKTNTCHSNVIASLGALATIYASKDDLTKAQTLQLAVVSQQHLLLGAEDPTTLESLNGLGQIYQAKGDSNKAIEIYKKIEILAPEGSLAQFNSRSNLGSLYFSIEDFAAAEEIQTKGCKMLQNSSWSETQREDAFVIATYNLALTKAELALLTQQASKRAEAIDLVEQAFHAARLTWTDSDARTAMILDTLESWKCEEPQLKDKLTSWRSEVAAVA